MSGSARLDTYLFRNLARQVTGVAAERPELVDRWLRLIEEEGFLARQAEAESSFDPLSRDLEEHLLPVLAERRDWPRFLRYALVAANLRDLVEALDSPRLLRALATDRLALARNLTGRRADPLARARGRAVLIGALEADGRSHLAEFGALVEELKSDLDALLRPGDPRMRGAEVSALLVDVAAHTAVQVRHRWHGWLNALPVAAAPTDDVRLATAEALLNVDAADSLGWELLAAVADRRRLGRRLGARAEWFDGDPPLVALGRLAELERAGEGLFWFAAPALVARRAEGAAAADALYAAACGLRPPEWDVETALAGAPLWARLPRRRVEEIAAGTGGEAAVAVWASLLPTASWAAEPARQAIGSLERAVPWVRWSLYRLAADPSGGTVERRRALSVIGIQLAELRFAVDAVDLARFLDLVAELDRRRLSAWFEEVSWGPAVGPEVLVELADRVRRPEVLMAMLENAERSAVTAAGGEAEGFALRLRLIGRLVGRLCGERRDLEALDRAVPRLLPEEEDEVRLEVVSVLAADASKLASEVCDGIRSPRLRRGARLEQKLVGALGAELSPADLYAAFVDFEAVEDEIEALVALREPPIEPWRVAEERLAGIRRHGRRITALADLARHALVFEQALYPPVQRDPEAALLPLREALGVVESERWLVDVTPLLVRLGAVLGGRHALGELRLGFETVVAETAVPWAAREEVIETLLDQGTCLLLDGSGRRGVVRAVRWFRSLLDLPAVLPRSSPAHDEMRRRWPRLLPRVVAAAERAPAAVVAGIRQPWRSLFGLLADGHGGSGIGAAVTARSSRWRWLDDEGREVVRCCTADEAERRRLAERAREVGAVADVTAGALAWLLAHRAPTAAASMLGLVAEPRERDRLHLALLLRAGVPAGDHHLRRVETMRDPALRRRARLAVASTPEAEEAAVRDLLVAGEVDRDDPRWEALRRRLQERSEAAEPLAGVVAAALAESGARAGFDAVRWWLAALLAVEPGRPPRAGSGALVVGLRRAVTLARSIAAPQRERSAA